MCALALDFDTNTNKIDNSYTTRLFAIKSGSCLPVLALAHMHRAIHISCSCPLWRLSALIQWLWAQHCGSSSSSGTFSPALSHEWCSSYKQAGCALRGNCHPSMSLATRVFCYVCSHNNNILSSLSMVVMAVQLGVQAHWLVCMLSLGSLDSIVYWIVHTHCIPSPFTG